MRASFATYRGILLAIVLAMLAGCANVHYEHGKTSLEGKTLVFGRITLLRDGERDVLSTFSTPVNIASLESFKEPSMIAEPFDKDGRFYWLLDPGQQVLTITLHEPTDDIVSLVLTVPDMPGAYYFGDLTLHGSKHFDTLGGANIRNVTAEFTDDFAAEKSALLQRNPGLSSQPIGKLQVADISRAPARAEFFRSLLNATPGCCKDISEFRYAKLGLNNSRTYAITRSHGTYDFPSGKSCFAAFELPEYAGPYSILLHSPSMPSGIPFRYRVFATAAMLLDDKFNVVATMETGLQHPVPAAAMPPRMASLEGMIDINAQNARAKYLVLYTTDRLLGLTQPTSVPGVLLIPGGAFPSGIPRSAGMMPWPTGKIEISLSPR